jgi:hypothetical protein
MTNFGRRRLRERLGALLTLAACLCARHALAREPAPAPRLHFGLLSPDSLRARLGLPAARRAGKSTVVGRLEVHASFASKELGTLRDLWVLLPPDYDTAPTRQRYPVIYSQDGQDLFDDSTAAGGEEWALDELLQARPQGIAPVIVVGIEAAAQARLEYAPPGSIAGARGEAYVRFVRDDVKPFIDRTYRTLPGREHTFLLGIGEGGLIAVYAAWSQPRVFGAAIALAWEDLDEISTSWARTPGHGPRLHFWIEQSALDMPRGSTTHLVALLRRSADVQVVFAERSASRPARVAAALRALLSPEAQGIQ